MLDLICNVLCGRFTHRFIPTDVGAVNCNSTHNSFALTTAESGVISAMHLFSYSLNWSLGACVGKNAYVVFSFYIQHLQTFPAPNIRVIVNAIF